ncbi:flagellar transcriptional regulator FlhD [Pantoea brenneri]|uniref:flagellar transcriptional regulator FlhD n=2 Tax=Pantoea brenneri TaxID=472694 RepID=UPI002896792A|nr:flagellar transcriptional regulator FlhD [Pantoea brenneri]
MMKTGMYSYDDRLQNIYAFNLSYLLLAQHLIQQDACTAAFFLGINEELINLLKNLPLPELLRLASVDRLICQLRIESEAVLNTITKSSRLEALQGIHAGIILSTHLLHGMEKKESLSDSMNNVVSLAGADKKAFPV